MQKKSPLILVLIIALVCSNLAIKSCFSSLETNEFSIKKVEHQKPLLELIKKHIPAKLDSSKILLDSAQKQYLNSDDEYKISLTSLWAIYYMHVGKRDSSLKLHKQALKHSLKANNEVWQLRQLSRIGRVYVEIGQLDSALVYLNNGLILAPQLEQPDVVAMINYDLAWVNIRRNFSDQALEYIQRSEGYYLSTNDSLNLVNVYNAYFSLYKNNGDFETASSYSRKAIKLAIESNNTQTLSNLYNNLGVAYWLIINDYDSSRYFLLKANALYDLDIKSSNYYLTNLINLGGMEIQAGNPQKGLEYLNSALEIVYPLEDQFKICALTINIGLAYVQLYETDSVNLYLEKGIQIAEDIEAWEFMKNAYYGLYEMDSINGDFYGALKNYKDYQSVHSKIASENIKNRIAELEIIHETTKKETENQFLISENALHEKLIIKQRFVYTVIIISLMILVVFMSLLLRNKRKLRRLNDELNLKNLEVTKKNLIIEEKNDNLELQKGELIILNQTKDKFFTIISHDLRGPFNSLLGLLNLLEEDFNELSDSEKLKIISRLHSNSRNTYNMLVNLLEWSRTQRGLIKPEFLSIPLFGSADSSITFLRQRIDDKKHKVINEIDKHFKVFADINLLLNIFNNLINNAIKFTPEGGEIFVSAKRIGDLIEIEVRDNGIGIPIDQQEKIFKMDSSFSRKGTNDELGTGLGLLTCKEFVTLMNGSCRLESKEGQGTSFFISLKSA